MNQGCSGQAGVFGTEPEKESVIFVNPWTAGSTECPPLEGTLPWMALDGWSYCTSEPQRAKPGGS